MDDSSTVRLKVTTTDNILLNIPSLNILTHFSNNSLTDILRGSGKLVIKTKRGGKNGGDKGGIRHLTTFGGGKITVLPITHATSLSKDPATRHVCRCTTL